MRIAIVTGSRDWLTYGDIAHDLNEFKPDLIVHGRCTTGADCLAEDWALSKNIARKHFIPDWKFQGRAAGPLRNTKMVVYGKDMKDNGHTVKVFAYRINNSKGTTDCIRQARMYGLDVKVMDMTE